MRTDLFLVSGRATLKTRVYRIRVRRLDLFRTYRRKSQLFNFRAVITTNSPRQTLVNLLYTLRALADTMRKNRRYM
jgi:hypothetical protein